MNDHAARVMRAWATLDLVVTGSFAIPPVAVLVVGLLHRLDSMLFGTMHIAVAPLTPMGLLFAGLTGALGVVWALARIREPTRLLGLTDAVARLWVGGLIAWMVMTQDVPRILLVFVITEWVGAAHQWIVLRKAEARA